MQPESVIQKWTKVLLDSYLNHWNVRKEINSDSPQPYVNDEDFVLSIIGEIVWGFLCILSSIVYEEPNHSYLWSQP